MTSNMDINSTLPTRQRSPALSHTHLENNTRRLSVTSKERQKLVTSIEASSYERPVVDFDIPQSYTQSNGDDSHVNKLLSQSRPNYSSKPSQKPRDPRDDKEDTAVRSSVPRLNQESGRPHSPYTLNPPVDFDGLSWPSELHNSSNSFQ